MRSFMVIELEVIAQASRLIRHRGVVKEINMLIFDGAPQAFDENVIQGAAATVHANLNASLFQDRSERQGRKLDALIGVENLGLVSGKGVLQSRPAKMTIKRVGQLPGDDIARPSASR